MDGSIPVLQTKVLFGFFAWVPLFQGLQGGILIFLETLVTVF